MNAAQPRTADRTEYWTEWRSLSACRDEDPEMFFPAPRSLTMFVQLARAKAICGSCPVAEDCLRYALTTRQDHGVWGGTSEEERRAMRRLQGVGSWPGRPGGFPAQAGRSGQPAARRLAAG
jgi:WhiB family transcriptional regulator, redox-sensing transcriptional regulator